MPGDFELILQMTAEMMVQAIQDKVHLPLQILLRNNADQEIYHVTLPEATGSMSWWVLHSYLMDHYGYLTFARKQKDGTIVVNPKKEDQVCGGESIWLIAADRPMNIHWPVVKG